MKEAVIFALLLRPKHGQINGHHVTGAKNRLLVHLQTKIISQTHNLHYTIFIFLSKIKHIAINRSLNIKI
jgi:hypothetical protein